MCEWGIEAGWDCLDGGLETWGLYVTHWWVFFISSPVSVVTQPMMQRRPNPTELRSMDWWWSYWKFAQPIKIVLITKLVSNKSIEWFYRNTFTPMWLKVTLLIRFSVQILYRMRRKCMQIPSWKGWAKCSLGSYLRPLGLYGCLECRVCWVNQVYGY